MLEVIERSHISLIIKLFNVALLQRVIEYILKIYNLKYILGTVFSPQCILRLQSFSMKTSVNNSI